MFVADPAIAPNREGIAYAHPDAFSDTGKPWRTVLLKYNDQRGTNPYGLLPAWQLYENPAYSMLADRFGPDRLYILSAGWGLIPARFLTPSYDITFSAASSVAPFKRRARRAQFHDFGLLPPRHHRLSGVFRWQRVHGLLLQFDAARQRAPVSFLQFETTAGRARLHSPALPHEDENQLALRMCHRLRRGAPST